MTKKSLISLLALLLAASLLASCFGGEIRENGDISDETSVETTAETVEPMRESTVETTTSATTETTEATDTTDVTEFPPDHVEATQTVPPEVSVEPVFLEDWELYLDFRNCFYLKNDETTWVFDGNADDGLLAGDVFMRTQLPAGTILLDLRAVLSEQDVFPGKTLFLLTDGRCVFFEQSTTEDREPVYNGKTEDDFFGNSKRDTDIGPVKVRAVRDHELLPETPLDPSIKPQNITAKVDWNGDGKVDTIKREITDVSAPWAQVLRYTDGATGKTTDITDRFTEDYLSDHVMLISGGTDNQPALVDCYEIDGSDYRIYIYTYDPGTIVSCEVIHDAAFVYEEGEMFLDTASFLFGNLSDHRIPVLFDGKTLLSDPYVSEIWWKEALRAKKSGDGLSRYFTYTLTGVQVEKKTSGGFVEEVIPVGVAIFPQYYYWDEDNVGGTGYVHFLMADGTECRAAFEYDTEYKSYWFGNDPQWELFHTSWAG